MLGQNCLIQQQYIVKYITQYELCLECSYTDDSIFLNFAHKILAMFMLNNRLRAFGNYREYW